MVWLVMIVLVSVVLAQYIMIGANDLLAVNRTEGTAEVSIPADADIDTVADILEEAGVINSAQFFKLYMKITKPDTTFTKGDYTDMQTNLDYEAIVTYLQTQSNRTDVVTVTFLEGMNLEDFGDTLEESGVCGKEEFLEKCNSTEFDEDYTFLSQITNSDERYYRLEGYLFPDTYDFYQDSDPETVIRKCLYNFELKSWSPLSSRRMTPKSAWRIWPSRTGLPWISWSLWRLWCRPREPTRMTCGSSLIYSATAWIPI